MSAELAAKRSMTLRVRRGVPGEAPRYDAYEVPFEPGTSVLDALRWIRASVDPTVAIRYSCVNANACKECVILVDGKVEYACTARLVAGEMTLDPLDNKPLVRDLVTDIAPPKERLANVLAQRKGG